MSKDTFLLGAVAYDPKVVTIWDGFREWLATHDFDFDYVLFSNYERQVEAHFQNAFHVAWNSPLAWIQTERIAQAKGLKATGFCMRDTDQDMTSVIVTRADSGIENLRDLKGKTVAVGAADSPQATLIPLNHLAQHELEPDQDFEVKYFDVLVGKHGDHIGGERDAAKALINGEVDAACMIDGNHLLFGQEGTLPAGSTKILGRTEAYDHCIFTMLDNAPMDQVERFNSLLLSMSYDDATVRHLLDLEGLKAWRQGRTHGFAQLNAACDHFGSIQNFVERVA